MAGWRISGAHEGLREDRGAGRMGLVARLIILAILALAVVAPSSALAQEYAPALGDLEGVPPSVAAGDSIALEGSGFAAGSTAEVSLMANEVGEITSLGTVPVDDEGNLDAPVSLMGEVSPGAYTISVSGDTIDGGVRQLSAAVQVVVTTTTTTSSTVSIDTTSAGSDEEGADEIDGVAAGDSDVAAGEVGDRSGGSALPYVLGVVGLLAIVVGALWWRAREQRS